MQAEQPVMRSFHLKKRHLPGDHRGVVPVGGPEGTAKGNRLTEDRWRRCARRGPSEASAINRGLVDAKVFPPGARGGRGGQPSGRGLPWLGQRLKISGMANRALLVQCNALPLSNAARPIYCEFQSVLVSSGMPSSRSLLACGG